MISLITPKEAQEKIATSMRNRRLIAEITQLGLSARSGVSLAVIRKFERTGKISLESFLKLAQALNVLENLLKTIDIIPEKFTSIDQVLADPRPRRKRGKHN